MSELEILLNSLAQAMPVSGGTMDLGERQTGLVIVDEINGFAKVGGGNLAPSAPDSSVERMVSETDRLARRFVDLGLPIAAFLDSHEPGKPEPPYPPHCEVGSGEEELVASLAWLDGHPSATLIRKDCINGFVGAIDLESGRNAITEWIRDAGLERVLVVGICTDICVMDFVLTLLSARNHGMTPGMTEIAVYADGCATYDLPRSTAVEMGLAETAAHPGPLTHHLGLYFMASRGAVIVSEVAG